MQWSRWLVLATVLAPWSWAWAQQPALQELGYLTCSVAEGADAQAADGEVGVAGQVRSILCSFKPLRGAAEETYVGSLRVVGMGQEQGGERVMMWVVKALPETRIAPGMLQQAYSPEAAAKPGKAMPLTGETRRSIVLQSIDEKDYPTTVQPGQTPGAVIISVDLQLRASPA